MSLQPPLVAPERSAARVAAQVKMPGMIAPHGVCRQDRPAPLTGSLLKFRELRDVHADFDRVPCLISSRSLIERFSDAPKPLQVHRLVRETLGEGLGTATPDSFKGAIVPEESSDADLTAKGQQCLDQLNPRTNSLVADDRIGKRVGK